MQLFLSDENLENKDMLNPIQEENHLTEEQEKSELCAQNNKETEEDDDTKYKFPDTQIKIDLSGPK